MAKTSSGAPDVERVDISVEASLFQNHVLAHDHSMSRHLLQRGQYAIHVLIRIHENDDHRKLSSSVNKMAGLNLVSPKKARHRMDCGCNINIFLPQVVEDFHVQRPMMPLVGFVEIKRNLNSHRVWHFTAPGPEPLRPALHRGK